MGNLLIVDDEIDLASAMRDLLEEEADRIFIATDGKKGLDILAQNDIHCVVSDIKMPIMDGLEFIRHARHNGIDVPFIFYTGHGSAELKIEARKLGAKELLTKPNFIALEAAIKKALG